MEHDETAQDQIEQAGAGPSDTSTTDASQTSGTPGASGADVGAGDGKDKAPAKSAFEQRMDKILESGASATTADDEAGDPDETDGAGAGTPAPKPAASKPAKPAATAAAGADTDGDGTDGADPDAPLVLAFPARRAEDPDFEVALDKETQEFLAKKGVKLDELVERANQARSGYERRQKVEADRRELETQRAQIEHVRTELAERPLDFIADAIEDERHQEIVEALLARMDDTTFAAIAQKIADWDAEPTDRKQARVDAREAAHDRREKRETAERTAAARSTYVAQIKEQVDSLVPEDMDDAEAAEFYDFAAHKLQTWASRQPKGTRLDPANVPAILDEMGALHPFGLSLPNPAKPGTKEKGKTGTPPARAGSRPAARPASSDPVARAARTGKDLQARRDRRREATATPAGAGAPAAQSGPPKGQTFGQRMDWLEKKLGLKK